jgi:hypothetical protein
MPLHLKSNFFRIGNLQRHPPGFNLRFTLACMRGMITVLIKPYKILQGQKKLTHDNALLKDPKKNLKSFSKIPTRTYRSNADGRWTGVVKAAAPKSSAEKVRPKSMHTCLSESSLFIWDDRILMITCGRTSLVRRCPGIIDIVSGKTSLFFSMNAKT